MKKIIIKKISVVILCILFICITIFGYAYGCLNPFRNSIKNFSTSMDLNTIMTKEQVKIDFNYLYEMVKTRHPLWLENNIKKQTFENKYKTLIKTFNNNMSCLDLYRTSRELVSTLFDGHTRVSYYNPKKNYIIDDFTHINSYGRPIKVNNISTKELFENYKKYSSYELDFYIENRFWAYDLYKESILKLLGIDTKNGITLSFNTNDGIKSFEYKFVSKSNNLITPKNKSWVTYSIDKDKNLGIFTLKQCNFNQEYKITLDKFFNEVAKNNISNIAVDLQNNGGGNSLVANEFIKYLDIDNYKTIDCDIRYGWFKYQSKNNTMKNQKNKNIYNKNLYIITNTNTYSSAMNFAMLIKDNKLGKIIGSTSGNLPTSYGDIIFFEMPYSKLLFSVSYKKWYRIDKSKINEPLYPDYKTLNPYDKLLELI